MVFLGFLFFRGADGPAISSLGYFPELQAIAILVGLKLGRVYRFYVRRGALENRGNRGRYRLPPTELLDCELQKCHPRSRRAGEGVEIPKLFRCRKNEKRLAFRSAELKDALCGSPACYGFM